MVKEDYHRNLSELLPYLQFSLYAGTYFAQVLGVLLAVSLQYVSAICCKDINKGSI